MATSKATIYQFPAQPRVLPTITAEQIAQYVELTSLISKAEEHQKSLRAELLTLHASGAEQETDTPYLLAFVEQERRSVDWKAQACALAEMLYGAERAANWKAQAERLASVQAITQIRVKPNPSYTDWSPKPAA